MKWVIRTVYLGPLNDKSLWLRGRWKETSRGMECFTGGTNASPKIYDDLNDVYDFYANNCCPVPNQYWEIEEYNGQEIGQ